MARAAPGIITFVIIIVVIIAIINIWCYAPSVFTCIVGGADYFTIITITIAVYSLHANAVWKLLVSVQAMYVCSSDNNYRKP